MLPSLITEGLTFTCLEYYCPCRKDGFYKVDLPKNALQQMPETLSLIIMIN